STSANHAPAARFLSFSRSASPGASSSRKNNSTATPAKNTPSASRRFRTAIATSLRPDSPHHNHTVARAARPGQNHPTRPAPHPRSAMPPTKYRVAVIGRTGKGNYGHGLDTVWLKSDRAELVAVADEDEAGRAAAAKRLKVPAAYADYREMLA